MERKKIRDLVNVYNNQRIPLSATQRVNLEKIYPYYGAQGIVDYVDNFIFDGNYILVAEDGENLRSNKQNICNLVNGKFWVNNHAHILSANDENVTEYLYYNFNQIKFEPYITGSAQPKLNKENLLNIETFVHSKSEQQKIAQVLSTLDRKIALNQQINTELEKMAKTLYDYWFVQFDSPDENANPYKSSGGEMVYHPELKREVPKGWGYGNITEIANLLGGGTPSKNNGEFWNGNIPFFTPTDCNNDVYILSTKDNITAIGLEKSSTKLFPENAVLLTARGSVGKLSLNAIPMAMNQSCYALIAKDEVSYSFLYFLARQLIHILEIKATGSVFNSIVSNDIETTFLTIPEKIKIKEFGKICEPIFEKIKSNIKQTQQLTQLRDFLLPMLMNGQVEVE